MPKLVDHNERRRAVALVAGRLVASGGVDAVTVRDVARAAGCSTAVVSHYFATKRELLLFTYREAAARARGRLDAALADDPGNVRGVLQALLPLDAERQQDWRVWFAFWGHAVADEAFADEQRERVRSTRNTLIDVLTKAGDDRPPGAIADHARTLLTVVQGISVQAVFDPTDWPPEMQLRVILRELGRYRRPTGSVTAGQSTEDDAWAMANAVALTEAEPW